MITPRFSCSQSDHFVFLSIYCPSIRAADLEIHVHDSLFTLHINPYFLRLSFPHNVLDDDASSAKYDPTTGYLEIKLTKEVKGLHFEDLDLLARLLAPRPPAASPSIQVLSSSTTSVDNELAGKTAALTLERQEILDAARNDWQLPQVPESPAIETSLQKHYGFLNMHSGYFKHATHTENEVNELGADAEICTIHERGRRRIRHENEKFDAEHYMADYADDAIVQEFLAWEHPYLTDDDNVHFTDEENLAMLNLPRKEYLSTQQQTHDLYLTLVTFLFSYAYDSRTTQHDPTPESAWTLCNLIPAFSALDPPTSPLTLNGPYTFTPDEICETLVASYRRLLAFPLYRSFALAETCRRDTARLLSRGKRSVTRCLLEMKRILDHHEVYYVYSKIWLEDFCVWVQAYASEDTLVRLGECAAKSTMQKSSIGWNLEQLENATRAAGVMQSDSDDETAEE
ncbi:hypothetical protein AX17_005105 [Amanita inopinata Kibby_2008]|nr:hypothetical protein AX17_005105 [Amanita inopinata Kibby_2008]